MLSRLAGAWSAPVFLAACASPAADTSWNGERASFGDTTVVVTHSGYLTQDSDTEPTLTPTRFWENVEFDTPRAMAELPAGRVVVADRTAVFVGSLSADTAESFGRRGRGPGEYQQIGGITALDGDTLLVWDTRLHRLTWVTDRGRVGRTAAVSSPRFGSALPVDLHPRGDSLVLAWRQSIVTPDAPGQVAYSLLNLSNSSHQIEYVDNDLTMTRAAEGILMPKFAFGPRALPAISSDGRFAYADGVRYTIDIHSSSRPAVTRISVTHEAPKVLAEARTPKPASPSSAELQFLEAKQKVQSFGERMNSIAGLKFDSSGRLWVRVVTSDQKYDSMILGRFPELRPDTYSWDVFALDGRRLLRVKITSAFEPLLIGKGGVYGVLELESGERVPAVAPVPRVLDTNVSRLE